MFWNGMTENEVVGSWQIPEKLKITAKIYIDFEGTLVPWLKRKPNALR